MDSNVPIEMSQNIRTAIKSARLRLLKMHFESGVGHIGGNLSCIDLLICLYHEILTEEDVFILSKGHSAGALYIALASVGQLSDSQLNEFHKDGTLLAGHPSPRGISGIRFGTGSLGHGLSLACGVALARKLHPMPGRIFALTSDGEWNEGSTWEGLIFACHHKLDNLAIIVDSNGIQGFGTTREVADLGSLASKLTCFGCRVVEIDGHNVEEILAALRVQADRPVAIVAKTVKGKGVSFLENTVASHYWPLSEPQYQQALLEAKES